MTKDELIAKQQIAIEELQERLERLDAAIGNVQSMLTSVGGPLNDNFRGYTKDQLLIFWSIKNELDV